jgi:hypothetical protein
VIGCRASLLLDEAGLKVLAEAPSYESGPAVDASVPGITFCAIAAEANNSIEQLTLQIISAPTRGNLLHIGFHRSAAPSLPGKARIHLDAPGAPFTAQGSAGRKRTDRAFFA